MLFSIIKTLEQKVRRYASGAIISASGFGYETSWRLGTLISGIPRSFQTSSAHSKPYVYSGSSSRTSTAKKFFGHSSKMRYFVIGVSGVTCGGKTSLTKLLQKKFPSARVIHQDHYFRDDDWPHHIRVPESENHVNYEIFQSLDMERMYEDVRRILSQSPDAINRPPTPPIQSQQNTSTPELLVGDQAETPNFDDTFLQQIKDIDIDVSKYDKYPILLIEGFTIFGSQYLYGACDARFFCTLDKETCKLRRSVREYFPPDSPSYFEKVIWPEYEKHFQEFINDRPGLTVFDGNTPMEKIWRDSVQIVSCRIEEKNGGEYLKHKGDDLIV